MGRRTLIAAGVAGAALGTAMSARAADDDWQSFRSRFVSPDGRVIDNASGGVSHSEGQGWGMLFAVNYNDRDTFEAIRTWTERTLRRPTDTLHAWRYVPADAPPVKDLNNATDGDIFIAAALARAGSGWSEPGHLQKAAAIARDILAMLVKPVGNRLVLLPGLQGFESAEAVVVNPSYYALPFIAELARLVPSPQWARLQRDGMRLIEQGRFGKWQLPPDWLRIPRNGGPLTPAPGWPPRYGFDAVRIPLWLTWQRVALGETRRALGAFWAAYPDETFPAWIDLHTGEVASYPATPGMIAIERLTAAALGHQPARSQPPVTNAATYYDAALIMLSRLARQKAGLG